MKFKTFNTKDGIWYYPENLDGNFIYFQYYDKNKMTTPYTVVLDIIGIGIRQVNVWHSNPNDFTACTGVNCRFPCKIKVFNDKYYKSVLFEKTLEYYPNDYELLGHIKSSGFKLKNGMSIGVHTNDGAVIRTINKYLVFD